MRYYKDKRFVPIEEGPHPVDPNGIRRVYEFANGYRASVVKFNFSYGGPAGLWELAIMTDGHINYDTPITDDVIGYLNDVELEDTLRQVAELPKRT